MKKYICAVFCIIFVLCLSACGEKTTEIETHLVESDLYSQQEIEDAIEVIKSEFKLWKGCTLTEIYYAGDDEAKEYQDWADRNNADEVIVLLSSFDTGRLGASSSLNSNHTYENWMWILVRTDGGQWQHVDHGY